MSDLSRDDGHVTDILFILELVYCWLLERQSQNALLKVMFCRTFVLNRERAVDYLNMLDRLYVFDGFAGWDPEVRSVMLGIIRS